MTMMSDEDRISLHKMLVSVYMKGKLEGQDLSKHEEAFNNSIEFLKQHGEKVGPNELEEFMKETTRTWSRHNDQHMSCRAGGYDWSFKKEKFHIN